MALRSRQLIATLALPIALLGVPSMSVAQTASPLARPAAERLESAAPIRLSEIKLDKELSSGLRPAAPLFQPGDPDSLTNGTLIGALVGAAAFGTLGGVICKAFQEPSDDSCAGDTFRIAAVGAAIGAGAGLAIDASLSRQGGVRFAVKKRF